VATSTIPAFKNALYTRLAARSGLSGVQVSYGWPTGAVQREHIILGGVDGTQEYRAIGAQHRFEEYTLTVYINVLREGVQQQTCDERCLALLAEVESELRSDPTVNNTVLTAELGSFVLDPMANDQSREARLRVGVSVKARI
jgi:hypothetical protein